MPDNNTETVVHVVRDYDLTKLEELVEAVRETLSECSACNGAGSFITLHGKTEFTHDCARCARLRTALAALQRGK